MANTITGAYENAIAKRAQKFLTRAFAYPKVASFEENNNLTFGVSVNRPYRNDNLVPASYTANTDVTAKNETITQQLLTINRNEAVSFKADPTEDKQIMLPQKLKALFAPRLAHRLGNNIDRDFQDEVDNAALDLDESDFISGSSSGDPIDLSSVNSEEVWLDAHAELMNNNIGEGRLYTIVDPKMLSKITQRGIEVGYNMADVFYRNGFTGKQFAGFDLYVSTNLPASVVFTYSATGANGKAFTINGVTFNQVTTIGTAAGNVLMETDATTCATNVKNFLNDLGTTSAKQVSLGASDKDKLEYAGISASSSAGAVTISAYGRMTLSVEASSNSSFGEQTVKSQCGQYGAIDMVVQMQPHVQVNKATNNLGSTILGHTLWGTKTFNEGAERLLKLSIKG